MERFEKVARLYVDHISNGGKDVDIQKYLVMLILTDVDTKSSSNLEYANRMFLNWPTYTDDIENSQSILNYRYPHTICDEVVSMNLEKSVRIIDVGCGPGYVASLLREHGYTNIDGLERFQCMIDVALNRKLYKHMYHSSIKPDKEVNIESGQYDVLVSSAAMWPGSIEPESLKEFVRLVKIGGTMIWNITDKYKSFKEFESYDEIIQQMIDEGIWCEVQPRKKVIVELDDYGYLHVMKRLK